MSSDDNLYLAGNFNTDEFVSTNEGTVITKWTSLNNLADDLIRRTYNNAFSVGIVSPILKSVKIKGGEILETFKFLNESDRSFSCLLYVIFSDLTMVNRSILWSVNNGNDSSSSFIGMGRDPAYPDKLCVFVKNTSTSSSTVYPTSYTIIKGVWCPIFFTYNYDTKTARCFVDNKKIYENTNLIADVIAAPPPPNSNNMFKYYKYFRFSGNIKDGDALSLKLWTTELTESQVADITKSLSFKIIRRLVSINITDSIQSIPSSGQYSYLEYPTDVKSKNKNTIKGTPFSDGSFYYLVLSQYGLYIVKNNNSNDIQMLWPADVNNTDYTKYSSYGLFIQTNGNLLLLGNPNKNKDGTISGGGKSVSLWNSGKTYLDDNVNRLYTLTLEGQSLVIRNKFKDIFYNSQDSKSLTTATSCVVENTNNWGPCTPSTCGTTGKQYSSSYVKTPATFGGPCDDKDKIFDKSCTNPVCQPIDCKFTTSDSPWSACDYEGNCGVFGYRYRKYKIIADEQNGGVCHQRKYPELDWEGCPPIKCPSPKDCEFIPTPSGDSWSVCTSDDDCNFSTQGRPYYKITTPPSNGGTCQPARVGAVRGCFNSDKCKIVDSIQSLSETEKYTSLEYPITTTTGKNAIRGTPLPDGSIYFLVLNNLGLHIVNKKDNIEDRQIIWSADTQKYNAYKLGLSGTGKLTLRANLTGTKAGDIVWNSGKEYSADNVNRLYTLRLEGQSLVIRNKFGDIFYNHKDSNANQQAIGCSLKESVTSCNPSTCGTTGKRTVWMTIASPSMYGGPCDDKDKNYEESCTNPACRNCSFAPTPSDTTWEACDANMTTCGLKGVKKRKKYKITSNEETGGSCAERNMYDQMGCFTNPCIDNNVDAIHSIPSSGQYSYLEYPVVKSKNTIKGTPFSDGSFYYLVLSQYGLYIIKNNNPDDIQMLWPKDVNDTSFSNYSSYGLFIQTNGNLLLIGNPNKNKDGTVDGSKGTALWNSGKTYVTDSVSRQYILTLEGKSLVIRNKYNEIFYNSQDSNSLNPSTACELTPSTVNDWTGCNPSTCGTSGIKTRPKYTLISPSTLGGPCDGKEDLLIESCTNPDCSIKVVPDPVTPGPATDVKEDNKKMYIIIGSVVAVLLILIIMLMK